MRVRLQGVPFPPGAPAKLSLDQVTTNHVCRQPAIYAKFCCEIVPPRSNSESETGSLSLSSTDTWRCCTFLLYLFLCFILSHPSIQFPKRLKKNAARTCEYTTLVVSCDSDQLHHTRARIHDFPKRHVKYPIRKIPKYGQRDSLRATQMERTCYIAHYFLHLVYRVRDWINSQGVYTVGMRVMYVRIRVQ